VITKQLVITKHLVITKYLVINKQIKLYFNNSSRIPTQDCLCHCTEKQQPRQLILAAVDSFGSCVSIKITSFSLQRSAAASAAGPQVPGYPTAAAASCGSW
jgi:hypothetical protein